MYNELWNEDIAKIFVDKIKYIERNLNKNKDER